MQARGRPKWLACVGVVTSSATPRDPRRRSAAVGLPTLARGAPQIGQPSLPRHRPHRCGSKSNNRSTINRFVLLAVGRPFGFVFSLSRWGRTSSTSYNQNDARDPGVPMVTGTDVVSAPDQQNPQHISVSLSSPAPQRSDPYRDCNRSIREGTELRQNARRVSRYFGKTARHRPQG